MLYMYLEIIFVPVMPTLFSPGYCRETTMLDNLTLEGKELRKHDCKVQFNQII